MARYLYIHIPFCLKKCIYCDFLSVPGEEPLQARYVEALKKELRLKAHETPLDGIYIGGGTPTVLDGDRIKEILNVVGESFSVDKSPEVTVEANPDTVDKTKLELLLKSGVNRLSIGVQSLEDRELSVLGRTHTAARALEAIKSAKQVGFKNISIDLIYGIPGQGVIDPLLSWKQSLQRVINLGDLGPEHISAYELTPESGTPLYKGIEQKTIVMPDGDLAADMFDSAVEMLTGAGYGHYEISNYALPGFECRHNLNYWRRGEYTGVGAGAHSFENGIRFKNTGDINSYIEFIDAGRSAAIEHEEADPVKEAVFLGLRMTEGIPLEGATGPFSSTLEGLNGLMDAERVGDFISEGLMEIKNNRLRLTGRGLRLYNRVVVELM